MSKVNYLSIIRGHIVENMLIAPRIVESIEFNLLLDISLKCQAMHGRRAIVASETYIQAHNMLYNQGYSSVSHDGFLKCIDCLNYMIKDIKGEV